MIIELFGPQGVGKTTFARALAAELRERHQIVDLVLSYRPAERLRPGPRVIHPTSDRATAVAIRLMRPVFELLTMTRHPLAYYYDVNTTANLLRILPSKNFLSSIRLSQYILRLSRSWRLATESSHVTLFDQAFVQAVCSLVLFSRAADEASIARALEVIPKPDMLIQLDAPSNILGARLRDRQRLQSLMERMLEIDPKVNIEANRIFEQLHDMLRRRGQAVICINSSDSRSLADAANRTAEQATAELRTRHQKHHVYPDSLSSEECQHV